MGSQAKVLLDSIEPIQLPDRGKARNRLAGMNYSICRLVLAIGLLLLVNFTSVSPVMALMAEAMEALCGGEVDFAYTINPATGMVLATKTLSFPDSIEWGDSETTVMQLLNVSFRSVYWESVVMDYTTAD